MFEFSLLTRQNFPRYLSDLISSENLFPENIRETPESLYDAVACPGSLAYVVHCRGDYAGNIIGFPPSATHLQLLRLDDLEGSRDQLLYLFNIVTMPQFQGQGLGRRMLSHFIAAGTQEGFQRVGGHFRGNASIKNFLALGGQVLASFDDWFETGETYDYCELILPLEEREY